MYLNLNIILVSFEILEEEKKKRKKKKLINAINVKSVQKQIKCQRSSSNEGVINDEL